MPDEHFAMADMIETFRERPAKPKFERLYTGTSPHSHAYAVLHGELNTHFAAINERAKTPSGYGAGDTGHYWADASRELIQVFKDYYRLRHALRVAKIHVELERSYEDAIESCEPWLSPSGGSTIPADFVKVELIEFEPVFIEQDGSTELKKSAERPVETQIGEGSYANVFSYVDPDYGIRFAVKRAKRGLSPEDQERFRQEFKTLKSLSFPYVIEVYKYDDVRSEYRMEFCNGTLESYIAKRNAELTPAVRKRVALQFLYGINYLHLNKVLHRDISLRNILVKEYDLGAVLVKLSDFGLAKRPDSELTRTGTEMKGTIRDPLLDQFSNYSMPNEINSIGHVLAFIFTGRKGINVDDRSVKAIVARCTADTYAARYARVSEIIHDVENLEFLTEGAPA